MQVSSYAWLAAMGWISKHFLSKKRSSSGENSAVQSMLLFSFSPAPLLQLCWGSACFAAHRLARSHFTCSSTRRSVLWVWENTLVTPHLFRLKKKYISQYCVRLLVDLNLNFPKNVIKIIFTMLVPVLCLSTWCQAPVKSQADSGSAKYRIAAVQHGSRQADLHFIEIQTFFIGKLLHKKLNF